MGVRAKKILLASRLNDEHAATFNGTTMTFTFRGCTSSGESKLRV